MERKSCYHVFTVELFLCSAHLAFVQVHCAIPKYKPKVEDHVSSRVSELPYASYINDHLSVTHRS